ncbi:hypothetical protein QR680_004902 [Steinernema hermaphroditum]|uniref:Uncharacterized protein n=1 Tax=Steinernema hermaphroditum TaxID=289476 RepID=A0AA39LTY5_9BILA|nr:hypothetical protein QR680_004902 [Steinernema hermaphroditum]
MESVPAVFIDSVLCVATPLTLHGAEKLRSRSWSRLARHHHTQRRSWRLCVVQEKDALLGLFRCSSAKAKEFLSLREFARTDARFDQIAEIEIELEENLVWEEDVEAAEWTSIASKEDVEALKHRFFWRINYRSLDWLNLNIVDALGLHSTILNHLVDKSPRIEILELAYEGPASTALLERQVKKNVITELTISGQWPPETTTPIVEAILPQRQLYYFVAESRILLSSGDLASLLEQWSQDDSPRKAKEVVIRSGDLHMEKYEKVLDHTKADAKVTTKMEGTSFTLDFSSVNCPLL